MSDPLTLSALSVAAVSLIGGVAVGIASGRKGRSAAMGLVPWTLSLAAVALGWGNSSSVPLPAGLPAADELTAACLLSALALPAFVALTPGGWGEVPLASLLGGGLLVMWPGSDPRVLAIAPLLIAGGPLLFPVEQEAARPPLTWRTRAVEATGVGLTWLGILLVTLGERSGSTGIAGEWGLVALLCGLGGLLGWFPFPRASGSLDRPSSPASILVRRLMPSLLGCVLLFRLTEFWTPSRSQIALLGIVAGTTVTLCTLRIRHTPFLSQRLDFLVLSTGGLLLIPVCLVGWIRRYPELDWGVTSNLPDAAGLFAALLIAETAALCLVASSLSVLGWDSREGNLLETLSGSLKGRPWTTGCLLVGELSLAGIAPFPGFWGRWTALGLCLLPHHRSRLTGLAEPDWSFMALAIGFLCVWGLTVASRMPFLFEVVFAEPLRIRRGAQARRSALALGLTAVGVAWLVSAPLSAVSRTSANLVRKSPVLESDKETSGALDVDGASVPTPN